jgi:hypothetical protein
MRKPELVEKWVDQNLGQRKPPFDLVKKSRYPEIRTYCPFCLGGADHKDRDFDFSFDINVEEGVCRCWRASCQWADSIETLVMEMYGVEYQKAKEILYGDFDDDLEKLKFSVKSIEKPTLVERDSQDFESLPDGIEKICSFNLDRDLAEWISERGYEPRSFVRTHNLYYPPSYRDKFEGRVLFGVNTLDRRSYLAYSYKGVEPKTLNPSGQTLSRMLFNYEELRFNKPDFVFITEGVFDACRLIQFGLKAVCVFGVHPSEVQCELLSNLEADEYAICFDNGAYDKMLDFKEKLMPFLNDCRVSIVDINEKDYIGDDFFEGMDPDDLNKKQFRHFFKNRRVFRKNSVKKLKGKINKMRQKYV